MISGLCFTHSNRKDINLKFPAERGWSNMDDRQIKEIVEKQIQLLSSYTHEKQMTLCSDEIADASRAIFDGVSLLHTL